MRAALSIRQPWASLIIAGIKDIENRSRRTAYRGDLLIHASRKFDPHADTQGHLSRDEILALPRGGIIGVVELVDIVEYSRSRWFVGPYGWILRNPRVLPFRACHGQLGVFQISPQQAAGAARARRR